jgi:hypothetical protein
MEESMILQSCDIPKLTLHEELRLEPPEELINMSRTLQEVVDDGDDYELEGVLAQG